MPMWRSSLRTSWVPYLRDLQTQTEDRYQRLVEQIAAG